MMTGESDHVRLILIEGQLREMNQRMDIQASATRDLVDLWRSARSMVALIVVLGKIGTAAAAIWLIVRGLLGLMR